jgi:putative NADH-flavin reductase
MTTIAVIGVSGYAGGHIATEALRRGHQVIGVSRTSTVAPRAGLTLRSGDISDAALIDDLARSASVIVVATHATQGDQPYLVALVPSLLKAAADHGVRLGFVGGAGSLLIAGSQTRLVETTEFPQQFKPEALAHADVLEALRASGSPADWFYVSPAAGFGSYAPGERTGTFRVGGETLLTDAQGNSLISGDDFAIAVVDEIETPAHHRERWSVAY